MVIKVHTVCTESKCLILAQVLVTVFENLFLPPFTRPGICLWQVGVWVVLPLAGRCAYATLLLEGGKLRLDLNFPGH